MCLYTNNTNIGIPICVHCSSNKSKQAGEAILLEQIFGFNNEQVICCEIQALLCMDCDILLDEHMRNMYIVL